MLKNLLRDFRDLNRSLAFAVDDFRKTFAQRAMSVDARKIEVMDRQRLQLFQRRVDRLFASPHIVEQPRQFRLVHGDKVAERTPNRQVRFADP